MNMTNVGYAVQRGLGLVAFSLLVGGLAARPAHADRVRQFDAEIRVEHDGTLDVKETIDVDFEGAQRHGIYRTIPVTYRRNGSNYTVWLNLQSVKDETGHGYEYKEERNGDNKKIRIGDADKTITGRHTYVLQYNVRRAVNVFDGKPEVYWNVTGNEWPYPIDAATARFYPPPGVKITQIRTASFQGPKDSKTPASITPETEDIRFSAVNLETSSGLTLVAGLPANSIELPTTAQNLWWVFLNWWPLVMLPLLTSGWMTQLWWRKGRDETRLGSVGVEWSPPQELSPSEVGTLIDESCDIADVLATLVDLAARGYLRIEEIPTQTTTSGAKDYRFVQLPPPNGTGVPPLFEHETLFLNGLFASATSGVVTLADLRNKFYTTLPKIYKAVGSALVAKGAFRTDPAMVRSKYYTTGILLFVGAFFVGGILSSSAWGVGVGLSGAIIFGFAKAMSARTARGVELLRHCLSFKRFVSMAESERIRVLAAEDPTIFGRLLPYAMALGVADQWANAFKDLAVPPPNWYVSNDPFYPTMFVSNLNSGVGTMGQTFSSSPSSSSAGSGGSGFSGGGSGGGFGGGGGGSW